MLYGNGTVLNTLRYGLGLASEVIKKNLLCYLQITPLREDGPAKARAILDNIASGAIEGYSNIRQAAADEFLALRFAAVPGSAFGWMARGQDGRHALLPEFVKQPAPRRIGSDEVHTHLDHIAVGRDSGG